MTSTPNDILCENDVFDIDFHPTQDIIALATITGAVEIYRYANNENQKLFTISHHSESCRAIHFDPNGQALYTASKDRSIRAYDTSGNPLWVESNAHDAPINSLHIINHTILASGDDQGVIRLWDTRQRHSIAKWHEHTDYIADMICNASNDHLLVAGGDGVLSVFDLRHRTLAKKSEALDDELLSLSLLKNESKIVCGSRSGDLLIFEVNAEMSDRFPGHPDSVESSVKVDEDTLLTGSGDGLIRVVQISPNKLLGIIGDHEGFPVEIIQYSRDKKLLASLSHINKVHFWDVSFLLEEGLESQQEKPKNDFFSDL